MKKWLALLLAALMIVPAACAEDIPLAGGWTPADSPEITEEIQAILDQALEGLTGVAYTPVAYLGSQVVAGTNHCILAYATPIVPNPQTSFVLIFLYERLDGQVEILNIADFDFGNFCTYGAP